MSNTTTPPLSHSPVTAGSPTDMFQSQLDASEINMAMFSMPTSGVAKRNAILDTETSMTSVASAGKQDSSKGSPAVCSVEEFNLEHPHPLNSTLDLGMTDEEALERRTRETEQHGRLSRSIEGTPKIIHQRDAQPLLICMVGLPARGKTYTSRRIMRYLAWLGSKCQVFNVAIYRRKNVGFPKAEFFDQTNDNSSAKLMEVFEQALNDTYKWISDGGQVAIFDGTNHSKVRRQAIIDKLQPLIPKDRMMFIELCNLYGGAKDPNNPDNNSEAAKQAIASMPEYVGVEKEIAYNDFNKRVHYYNEAYEPVTKDEGVPFLRCSKDNIAMHHLNGYLTGRLSFLMMNLRVMHRKIFMCLTGEEIRTLSPKSSSGAMKDMSDSIVSDCSTEPPLLAQSGRMNSKNALSCSARLRDKLEQKSGFLKLTSESEKFADSLIKLLKESVPSNEPVTVWSSNDQPGLATIHYLQEAGYPTVYWRYLGEFGFSVAQKMMGETYEDIIERLEPVIFEIERCETHLLICGHTQVMNALYGYLAEGGNSGKMRKNTIVKVQPRAYDLELETYAMCGDSLQAVPSSSIDSS